MKTSGIRTFLLRQMHVTIYTAPPSSKPRSAQFSSPCLFTQYLLTDTYRSQPKTTLTITDSGTTNNTINTIISLTTILTFPSGNLPLRHALPRSIIILPISPSITSTGQRRTTPSMTSILQTTISPSSLLILILPPSPPPPTDLTHTPLIPLSPPLSPLLPLPYPNLPLSTMPGQIPFITSTTKTNLQTFIIHLHRRSKPNLKKIS
jgi:hypothetical protein